MHDDSLKLTEKYVLAQVLVCGAIDGDEFEQASEFSKTVRERALKSLSQKDILQKTLYEDTNETEQASGRK